MMCRYGMYGPYKFRYACFTCRKMFRQVNTRDRELYAAFDAEMNGSLEHRKRHEAARVCLCPQCRQPMHNMGFDFKAPRQSEVDQWHKVEILHARGYRYSSCGCCGPGYRPETLKEVPAFLRAEEERCLQYARQKRNEDRARERNLQRKKNRQTREAKQMARIITPNA